MAEGFGAEVKQRIENAALLGGYLDTARQEFGALPPAPGLLQERRKPGSVAEYQTRRLGMKQNIAGLESQYAEAVGNPTNALVSPAAVPALQSPEIDQQPGFGAVLPAESPAAPGAPTAAPVDIAVTQPFGQPMSARPFGVAAGVRAVAPANAVDGYQPIQSQDTYDEQGNLVHRAITGSGTPAGYGAREPIVIPDLTGIGGLIGMKQAANANAISAKRAIAQAALEQNAALKRPGAMGDQLALTMALEVAKRGGDPREVMAVLKGHPPVADIYATEPSTSGKADETRVRTNKRTGAVEQVKPTPPKVTQANLQAYMRDNPKATKAQAIEAHRARGLDVSDLK